MIDCEGGTLIDGRAHLRRPTYVDAAIAAGHTTPDGMPAWPTWSPEQHLRMMDDAGLEMAVRPVSSPGVHFANHARACALAVEVNDFAGGDSPAAVMKRLWFDVAGIAMPANAAALIDGVVTNRILYGSDHCFTPAGVVRRQVDSLDVGWPRTSDLSWRAVTTRNARELFDGVDATSTAGSK